MYRMEGSPKLKHCCPCECWSQSNRVTALFHSAISADLATALWSPAAATLPPDTPFRAATRTKTCPWVAKNKQIVSGFSYLVWVQWGFLSIPSSSPLSSVWALWMNVNLQWCTITVAMVQPCHMCHWRAHRLPPVSTSVAMRVLFFSPLQLKNRQHVESV